MSFSASQVDTGEPPGRAYTFSPSDLPTFDGTRPFGDPITAITDSPFRLGFLNFGGLPPTNNDPKNKLLFELLNSFNFHVFGISEINLNWRYVSPAFGLAERTLAKFESMHRSTAYLEHWPPKTSFQVGGVHYGV
jgi:hypothetical protein